MAAERDVAANLIKLTLFGGGGLIFTVVGGVGFSVGVVSDEERAAILFVKFGRLSFLSVRPKQRNGTPQWSSDRKTLKRVTLHAFMHSNGSFDAYGGCCGRDKLPAVVLQLLY